MIGARRSVTLGVQLVPVDAPALHRSLANAFSLLLRPRMRRNAPVPADMLGAHISNGARALASKFLEACSCVQRNKLEAYGYSRLAIELSSYAPLGFGERNSVALQTTGSIESVPQLLAAVVHDMQEATSQPLLALWLRRLTSIKPSVATMTGCCT